MWRRFLREHAQHVYRSLLSSQNDYYARYRFADVFAELKRAPEFMGERLKQIPGVANAQTRVIMDATLDVPNLNEPALGRLISIPPRPIPILNDLFIRSGRYVSSNATDEVIASEAFVMANRLSLDSRLHAVINGRWKELRIVGIALSPEYIYEIRGGGRSSLITSVLACCGCRVTCSGLHSTWMGHSILLPSP